MKKKTVFSPFVLMSSDGPLNPGEGPNPGLGSSSTTQDEWPCSYEEWLWMFFGADLDVDNDGEPGTFDDYAAWMNARGWGEDIRP